MVACRRQANAWQRVVLYTNGWARMDTLGTVTNAQTTTYQPMSIRRGNGWYIIVCSNGYIYLSNTGEYWRGIGATNRALKATDVDNSGYVYATEYEESLYIRVLKTVDYINWVVDYSNVYPPSYQTFKGYCCKTHGDGYTYITQDYLYITSQSGTYTRNYAYCKLWKVKAGSYSLFHEDTWGQEVLSIGGTGGSNTHVRYCASIANNLFVTYMRLYCNFIGDTKSTVYENKLLYVDGVSKTPPSTNLVTDCIYIVNKYILSTTGNEIYSTSDFSAYTLKISYKARKMRGYSNIAYICTDDGLYTTTDGNTFTNQDNTRDYYDVAEFR